MVLNILYKSILVTKTKKNYFKIMFQLEITNHNFSLVYYWFYHSGE